MVGTPAYEAGVLAGDLIMEIDGHSTEGMSPDKAVEVLTGRPGTDVKLTVLHEGTEQAETVDDHPGDHRGPQRPGRPPRSPTTSGTSCSTRTRRSATSGSPASSRTPPTS